MTVSGPDALDAEAQKELALEWARHAASWSALTPGDREALGAEFKCHMANVQQILRDHSSRVGIDRGPPAQPPPPPHGGA